MIACKSLLCALCAFTLAAPAPAQSDRVQPAPKDLLITPIAPDGVWYVLKPKSLETSDGILSLKPGEPLTKQKDGSFCTADGKIIHLAEEEVTNRPELARQLRGGDLSSRPTLGLTEAEALDRFGEPVKISQQAPADKVLTFLKDDIYIVTFLYRGRIHWTIYMRTNRVPFSNKEAEVLFNKNSQNKAWTFVQSSTERDDWECPDGKLLGMNYHDSSNVSIITESYLEAMQSVAAAKLRKGF